MNKEKAKKQFLLIGRRYVLYVLDNRDGHIEGAERDVLVLDVSYIDLCQLTQMTEQELFDSAEDTCKFMTADEIY